MRKTSLFISLLIAAAVTGCHGQSSGSALPTQNQAAIARNQRSSLMYASDTKAGQVVVYTYPEGALVTTLTDMTHPSGECTDAAGNIYITNYDASYNGSIYVFAHGADSPTQIVPFNYGTVPNACSVDPITGDLAVANSTDQIHIYNFADQSWSGPIDIYMGSYAVAYDKQGDLFFGGPGGQHDYFTLAEIPKNNSSLFSVTLNKNIGGTYDRSYSLQWRGNQLILSDLSNTRLYVAYRIKISGQTGTIVGAVKLRKNGYDALSGGYAWIDHNSILAPNKAGDSVAVWKFPEGGKPRKNILSQRHDYVGVTISKGVIK